ncbi:spore germination protein [Paenibacillus alkalitolerans]|uniref:spore germination protein n=1 Tax=Paenibacillus alkalitolerans TaxID=2799335 RepID=UPI002D7FAE62|nr:spore germination protein [Paenibacillus alkalitolerans]
MRLNRVVDRILIKEPSSPSDQYKTIQQQPQISSDLRNNLENIKDSFGNSPDIVIREFMFMQHNGLKIAVIYMEGLADAKSINHFILEPLMSENRVTEYDLGAVAGSDVFEQLMQFVLPVGGIEDVTDLQSLFLAVLSGKAVILADGYDRGVQIGLKGWQERAIEEPTSQPVIRGPKEGFSESISTNIALVRRKIMDPGLWLESLRIGRVTKTNVSFMYLRETADDKVVREVRTRLERIRIDGILESGYIEELIQDKTYTPFPTMFNSERPDVIAAGLLEGRVAIFVDGTPFALLVPAIFPQFFHAAEDYYQRSDISTLLRIIRYIAFFIALLGPSLYIAVTTFHHEMLPTPLLVSLTAQREGVPFPAFVEALMMEVTFELLREAGVRLPRAVGQAISIVGALVIGQAAVEAGIISAVMVIVVSITAIASFVIPSYNMGIAVRMLRFGFMGLAASFGLYGIVIGLFLVVQHLCKLSSFGVPFMSPYSPVTLSDHKDVILRAPWWGMFSRPRSISRRNPDREDSSPE